jgi:L-seryl-tRNA(Ser) seleniumtransferase
MDENKQAQLKRLPGVDRILESGAEGGQFADIPKSVLIPAIRAVIEDLRTRILESAAPVGDGCFSMAW